MLSRTELSQSSFPATPPLSHLLLDMYHYKYEVTKYFTILNFINCVSFIVVVFQREIQEAIMAASSAR